MKVSILTLFTLILIIPSCGKIKEKSKKYLHSIVEEIKEPVIEESQVFDLFPELKKPEYQAQNIKGLRAEYLPDFYEYYFKYSGNQKKILEFICSLQVDTYHEIEPDSSCTLIGSASIVDKKDFSNETLKKLAFFFEYEKLDNYEVFQTVKTPLTHTIILDQNSQNIYHRIQEFRE